MRKRVVSFLVQLPCGSYSTNRTDGLNSAFDALHQVTIDVRSPVAGKIESVQMSCLLGIICQRMNNILFQGLVSI